MGEPVQLIPAGSQLWAEYLHPTRHDFYYSEAYHDFMQEQGYGEAWLAVVGSREKFLIWPFLLRSVNSASAPHQKGMRDVTSVYGYTGPLASGCTPGDPFLSDAWNALLTHWRASGVVSLFCRFHPLLENHRWVADSVDEKASAVPPLQLTLEGHTVSLDLDTDRRGSVGGISGYSPSPHKSGPPVRPDLRSGLRFRASPGFRAPVPQHYAAQSRSCEVFL